jgi:outer membrane lipoprotein LolB
MAVLAASFLISGCALAPSVASSAQSDTASWRGRLAVRVDSNGAPGQSQSFAAGFELTGNAQVGELTLYTPLGTTAASLSWSEQSAVMRSAGDQKNFESLTALIRHAIGTEVPVAALFAWLAGDNMSAAGWSADLSNYATGSILASRTEPAPAAQIRLILEK